MQLTNVIQPGKLIYFSQQPSPVAVYENKHYRWMVLAEALQSLMLKRRPYQLTLPHHTALLLPLLFLRPQRLLEFGLGGANLGRFLLHLQPSLQLTSIEYSPSIINAFEHYFNPQSATIKVVNKSAEDCLVDMPETVNKADWLIYDVFGRQSVKHNQVLPNTLQQLVNTLNEQSCLSINLPSPSKSELAFILARLHNCQPGRKLIYFHLARYQNIVIHIMPASWQASNQAIENSDLPARLCHRWLTFWQSGQRYPPFGP